MSLHYNKRIILIFGVILLISSVSYPSDYGVPLVGKKIRNTDVIIGGTISLIDSNDPVITITKTFKGSLKNNEKIRLKLNYPILYYTLGDFLKPFLGEKVIIFGNLDKNQKTLILIWNLSSVWPNKKKGNLNIQFEWDTYKKCEDFLLAFFSYLEAGEKDKNLLIENLLKDVHLSDKRCAVLAYCNEMLTDVISDKELRNQVITALLAEIITNKYYDIPTVNNISYLSTVPQSIGASYMLRVSNQKENERSEFAFNRARVLLGITKKEAENNTQLTTLMTTNLEKLHIRDAKEAIKIYDSANSQIKSSADKIMNVIFNDINSPDISKESGRDFWLKKIQEKQNLKKSPK